MTFPTIRSARAIRYRNDGSVAVRRDLPEEVPVALVFNGTTHAVMMATPADIGDFACGFAVTEQIVGTLAEIERYETIESKDGIEARLWLNDQRADALAARRRVLTGPVGCGLCEIDSLKEAARKVPHIGKAPLRLRPDEVCGAIRGLRAHQPLHDQTVAAHAAGFFIPGEGMVLAREDVGRHNALDKLIGAICRAGLDPSQGAAVITSRVSVDLVQKCAISGISTLIAVSAPTGYAARVADEAGMTLIAFAREDGFEVYTHPARISDEDNDVA